MIGSNEGPRPTSPNRSAAEQAPSAAKQAITPRRFGKFKGAASGLMGSLPSGWNTCSLGQNFEGGTGHRYALGAGDDGIDHQLAMGVADLNEVAQGAGLERSAGGD